MFYGYHGKMTYSTEIICYSPTYDLSKYIGVVGVYPVFTDKKTHLTKSSYFTEYLNTDVLNGYHGNRTYYTKILCLGPTYDLPKYQWFVGVYSVLNDIKNILKKEQFKNKYSL